MKLNLSITIPSICISATMLCIVFQVSLLEGVFFYGVPLIYAVLSVWWGIFIDLRYTDYSGETESQTMNQGMPFVLGYLPGSVLPMLGMICMFC